MDVMIDIETLGTAPGSVILSIGAVAFVRDRMPEDWREFSSVISVESSKSCGLTTDQSTIDWWKRQDSYARHRP